MEVQTEKDKIQNLKKKYGKIRGIKILDKEWIFKKPDMATLSAVMKLHKDDPLQASQIMFLNCLVDGDPKAVEDVDIFINLHAHLNELVDDYTVEVKNY